MVRAAVSRAVDFERADPNDKWWWRRTNLILEEIARRDRLSYQTLQHQHWIGLAGSGRIDSDNFAKAQANAGEVLNNTFILLFPWQAGAVNGADLVQMWVAEYGDPSLPETQAKIDEWVAAIESMPTSVVEEEE